MRKTGALLASGSIVVWLAVIILTAGNGCSSPPKTKPPTPPPATNSVPADSVGADHTDGSVRHR